MKVYLAVAQRKENLLKTHGRVSDTQNHAGTCSRSWSVSLLELGREGRTHISRAEPYSISLNEVRAKKNRI